MSKGKVVIIVLVVLVVILALGIGSGAFRGKGSEDDYRKGWVGDMDGITGRFSPKLDRRRLQMPQSRCRLQEDTLEVDEGGSCEVIILPDTACDDSHQVARLSLAGPAAVSRRVPPASTLSAVRPDDVRRFEASTTLGRFRPPGSGQASRGLLKLSYEPYFKDATASKLTLSDQEERLVVLPTGGKLTLECRSGCDGQPLRLVLSGRADCR